MRMPQVKLPNGIDNAAETRTKGTEVMECFEGQMRQLQRGHRISGKLDVKAAVAV